MGYIAGPKMVSFSCEVSWTKRLFALWCPDVMGEPYMDGDGWPLPLNFRLAVIFSPRRNSIPIATNVAAHPSPALIAWSISRELVIDHIRYGYVLLFLRALPISPMLLDRPSRLEHTSGYRCDHLAALLYSFALQLVAVVSGRRQQRRASWW